MFTPSAMEAGAPAGVSPEPVEPAPAPPAKPATTEAAAPIMTGEPEPGFAYMPKTELRAWLAANAANVDVPSNASKSTLEKFARGALADMNRARGAR